MTSTAPAIDRDELGGMLRSLVAPWVAKLDLQLLQAQPGEVVLALPVVTCVLRMGHKLVFGEIEILDASGELAAHATNTCALV
jgi:hypothetical protein